MMFLKENDDIIKITRQREDEGEDNMFPTTPQPEVILETFNSIQQVNIKNNDKK